MNNSFSSEIITDKVVFISGAGSGIGRATSLLLAQAGAKVFSLDINEKGLEETLELMPADSFGYVTGSVADEHDVKKAFAECRSKFGAIDVLLNNAGLGIPTPDLENFDMAVYHKMIDVNMTGVLLCTREALSDMKTTGKGHIITVISMAGQRSNPSAPLYCASKFGARGINSGLADQVLKLGIKVTDINPGPVNSNYWGDREVPREKFLSVDDVANVVKMVLSTPDYVVIREINFDNINWLAK